MNARSVQAAAGGFLLFLAAHAGAQTGALTPEEEKRSDMRIPELDRSALEPEKRTPSEVLEGERNPFGLMAAPKVEEKQEVKIEVETEEMKIRRVLANMRVTGLSGQPGSYRVLLGTIQLAKGDIVPRLFADQGEVVQVQDITDRQLVLSFVERKQQSDMPPRMIGLPVDLDPRVRSVLPGDLFTNVVKFDSKGAQAMDALKTDSVDSMVKAFETNQLTEALTERRRQFLGESYPPPKNEPLPAEPAE